MVTIIGKSSTMERVGKKGHSYSIGRPPKRHALQEWFLLSEEDKSTWQSAIVALKSKLEMRSKVLTAQDFRHIGQKEKESVADFIY